MNIPATNSSSGLGVENLLESERRVEDFFFNVNLTFSVLKLKIFEHLMICKVQDGTLLQLYHIVLLA